MTIEEMDKLYGTYATLAEHAKEAKCRVIDACGARQLYDEKSSWGTIAYVPETKTLTLSHHATGRSMDIPLSTMCEIGVICSEWRVV